MRKKRLAAVFLALTLAMASLNGCGGGDTSLDSALDDGASQFADGKEDKDYGIGASDEVLQTLMDDFAGSMLEPTAEPEPIDPGDAQQIIDDTEDEEIAEPDVDVLSSDDELKELVHKMLDETKEVAVCEVDAAYTFDAQTVIDIYDQLYFEDAYDIIGLASVSTGSTGNSNEKIIQLNYHMDIDQMKQMKADTRTLGKQHAANINTAGMSEYEIICAVDQYLCDLVYYPEQDAQYSQYGGYRPEDHTAYSAFQDGRVVCDGYSRAAKILLNELGVECGVEVGICTNGGGHAWNLVKVDGEWYQMDVTWNDTGETKDYLLVTDDFMKQSRTWQYSWYPATPTRDYTP